jgi:hypothetical protein
VGRVGFGASLRLIRLAKSSCVSFVEANFFRALDLYHAGVVNDNLHHAETHRTDLSSHRINPSLMPGGRFGPA